MESYNRPTTRIKKICPHYGIRTRITTCKEAVMFAIFNTKCGFRQRAYHNIGCGGKPTTRLLETRF